MAQSFFIYHSLRIVFAYFLVHLFDYSLSQNNTEFTFDQVTKLGATTNESEVNSVKNPEDINSLNIELRTVRIDRHQASLVLFAPLNIVSVTVSKVKVNSGETNVKETTKEYGQEEYRVQFIPSTEPLDLLSITKESKEDKLIDMKPNKELKYVGIEWPQVNVRSSLTLDLVSVTKQSFNEEEERLNSIVAVRSADTELNYWDCINCTRRCISCSNTELEECNDPSDQVLPIEQCPQKDDSCYTKHNPFGVVTRGCHSLIHTGNYFSCACNLCNYLAIQEMPFFFSELSDWKKDVITISRIKSITSRPYLGVECLHCEVWKNDTEREMSAADMYCLEGDLEHNPYKKCQDYEVCGIRVVRDSYLWRGCHRYPVYNSWWTLCDENLCNNEALIFLDDIAQEDDKDDFY